MTNIHIPEGMTLQDYINDSISNAIANGDADFLRSLEERNAGELMHDMCTCDAGVEYYVYEDGRDVNEAQNEVLDCINKYFEQNL